MHVVAQTRHISNFLGNTAILAVFFLAVENFFEEVYVIMSSGRT